MMMNNASSFFANGTPYDENLKDKCLICNGHGYTKYETDGIYKDMLCYKCKGSGVYVERDVQGNVEGVPMMVNPETTLCIMDFSLRRFVRRGAMTDDIIYNEDPLFMRDIQIITMPDDRPYVVIKNTIVLKEYFDAAMRICSSFAVGGCGNWKDIRFMVSDEAFQPVAFMINETYAVLVAPVVPIYLPELDTAISKIQAVKELIEKENRRNEWIGKKAHV